MKKRNFIILTIFGVVLFIFDIPKWFNPVHYIENNDVYKESKQFVRKNMQYTKPFYKEEQHWFKNIWLMLKSHLSGKLY